MGRLDPCAFKSGVIQRVYKSCAFCEVGLAVKLIRKLIFLRIGLDMLVIEWLCCAVVLSLIVHGKVVISIDGRRSLMLLRRYIRLGLLFLRSRIKGIEAGRPDVLALSGFAS